MPARKKATFGPDNPAEGGPEAAPLEKAPQPARPVPPAPGEKQPLPHLDDTGEIVAEDGRPLRPEELFTDLGEHYTFVRARVRIHERFAIPHSRQTTTRLLLAAGAPVSRSIAAQLIRRATKPGSGEDDT
jgi:hypothetical protein